MSVIERMIQRARAPHSSGVQPLLPPRFAVHALKGVADETPLELHSAHSLVWDADSPAKHSATKASVGEEPRSDSPSPTPPSRLLRHETEGAPLADRRRSSSDLRDGGASFAITQVANKAPSQDLTEIAAATQHVERSSQSSVEPSHTSERFPAERVRAASQQDLDSSFTNDMHRPRQENDSGEKRTAPDVSITIGHIEVHAAQPAERISRSQFRPRVSLDDFLGQHSGKQS